MGVSGKARGQGRSMTLLTALVFLVTASWDIEATMDADRIAATSRRIREEFRRSGFNWISPKQYKSIDMLRNIKPFMFLFTTTSCQDCRDMLDSLAHEEDPAFLSNLSAQFNAVLVLDDYTLEFGPEYAPRDADYTPRVIFSDPDGTIRNDIINVRADKAAPYFYNAKEMLWGMRNVLLKYTEEQEPYPSDLDSDIPS